MVSSIVAQDCTSLPELRFRGLQVLVRYIDLLFQRIQLRILKNRPPFAAEILFIRFGWLPVPYLFVCGRSLYRRRMVLWANRASSQL
jgi:hypothetical protein